MTKLEADVIATSVVEAMTKALAPVQAKLQAVEQELAALKAAPHLKYCGTWQSGTTYQAGDATTFSGSLWVCKAAHTASGPVADHQYWQLAVKRGKGDR
jgi:hypothetical protein